MEGRSAWGLWRGHHLAWLINYLEMLAVFHALRYFLPDLRGHVLIRTNNVDGLIYNSPSGSKVAPPMQTAASGPALALGQTAVS